MVVVVLMREKNLVFVVGLICEKMGVLVVGVGQEDILAGKLWGW